MIYSRLAPALRRIHYGWVVAATSFVTMLATAGAVGAPGVMIGPLQREFGWSNANISAAVAIRLVLFGLMGPFAAACPEIRPMKTASCKGKSPSLEKRNKKLLKIGARLLQRRGQIFKSFLLLFFKKEELAFLSYQRAKPMTRGDSGWHFRRVGFSPPCQRHPAVVG